MGLHDSNIVPNENPVWVEFARSLMPMMIPAAHAIADRLASRESIKVLDISAGHRAFGIALARRNPRAEIVALDWKPVLGSRRGAEHARAAGGRVAVLEFMPNPDRVSPPMAAGCCLTMLAETAAGGAFTLAGLREQLEDGGFRAVEAHGLPTPQTPLIARQRGFLGGPSVG